MPTRITASDITDRLIKPVVTADSSYFTRADSALDQLALTLGLLVSQIVTPAPYAAVEYLKALVGLLVCQDNMGVNPRRLVEQGVQDDPYAVKLEFYQKQVADLQGLVTVEILTGTAVEPEDYSYGAVQLFRGS
jgi:hypothetical protein